MLAAILLALTIPLCANAIAAEAGAGRWSVFAWRLGLLSVAAAGAFACAKIAGIANEQALLGACVLVAAYAIVETDGRYLIIPDVCIAVLLSVALIVHAGDLFSLAAGALINGALMLFVRVGYALWRDGEGLGFGDVKLAVAMGALLGPELAASALFAGSASTLAFMLLAPSVPAKLGHVVDGQAVAPLGCGLAAATFGAFCYALWGAA